MLLLPSCALQLVSDFDQQSLKQMELVAKKVNRLFIKLSYLSPEQRNYHQVKSSYMDVDVELQALKTRQQLRPLNELTLKQLNIIISLWQQGRDRHKSANTVSDFLLKRHQKQYNRMFVAMIKGEESKKSK